MLYTIIDFKIPTLSAIVIEFSACLLCLALWKNILAQQYWRIKYGCKKVS